MDERHTRPITVSVLDTATSERRTSSDWPRYWWTDGNGACDCNRAMLFDDSEDDDDEAGCGICKGCHRYLVVATSAGPLSDYNAGYLEDLVKRHA